MKLRDIAAARMMGGGNSGGPMGSVSWNDLTDKPFGEVHRLTILPETTLEAIDDGEGFTLFALSTLTLVSGAKYVVNYNGVEYMCECFCDGECYCLGNYCQFNENVLNTGEPFMISNIPIDDVCEVYSFDGSTTITVSITKVNVTPIPKEYIPIALPYYIDVVLYNFFDPHEFVIFETKDNIMAVLKSGRELKLRLSRNDPVEQISDVTYFNLGFVECDHNSATLEFVSLGSWGNACVQICAYEDRVVFRSGEPE